MTQAASRSFVHAALRYPRALRALADRVGRRGDEAVLSRDAADYWGHPDGVPWQLNSHWREPFADQWETIGKESLAIAQQLARTLDSGLPSGRTIEWGAGGGANAIHFAPLCQEFVAVDVVEESLGECARQVRLVCDTPVSEVLISVEDPEAAIASVGEQSCDLFLCFYVMELVPSPEYGLRILSIARRLLRDGGVAVFQVKYSNANLLSRSRRRSYRRGLANMTTYAIDEFWTAAADIGLEPSAVRLVPENFLDKRYAYFLLTRP
jgi:SAM-dependent methyltransferase